MTAHKVILASAGTGKTYRLAGRFLERLFDGVPPERILATTFTRKAAGEILERVLKRLVVAVDDEAERERLLEPGREPPDRATVVARLAELARRIDRFDVRTLDSFFIELVRVFGMELGLPAGWRVSDPVDEDRLRAEAVGRVLDEVSPPELIELMRALQKNQARRSVHAALMDIVKEGHAAFRDSAPGAWESCQPPEAPDDATLAAAIETLDALPPALTNKQKPHKGWLNGRTTSLDRARGGDWVGFAESGFVKGAAGDGTYYGLPIDEEHLGALEPLITRAAHDVVAGVAYHARHMHALIARYDLAFVALQRERRAYRFEDFPQALVGTHWHGTRGDFRRDGALDHLLLDEFQDTSPLQWRVLRPLAEEILDDSGGARSLFCVGDLKQSIYGWRAGEPRLLSDLAARHPDAVECLDKSYRSGRVVLETINQVFGDIATNVVLAKDAVLAGAAANWQQRFGPHRPAETVRDLPSAARLLEVPASAESPRERAVEVVRAAARHVAELHRQTPDAEIGVLFRRKQDLPLMLRALRDEGVMASGEGGNPVTDSALVNVVLSLVWLADHPADSAARYHVATSALAAAAPDEWIDLATEDDPEHGLQRARELASTWRERLARDGYGPSLGGLGPFVQRAHADDAWERDRFGQLVDLAYAWDARATGRPADFVGFVRATAVEDPRAAPVKVITVHRAKGLEFDAVVLPDLDARLIGRPNALITERLDPNEPYTLVCPHVSRDRLHVDPTLARAAQGVRERALQEELCVLYVAMTRAKRRLDMLVSSRTKGDHSASQSFAMILRKALAPDDEEGAQESPMCGELRVLWAHPQNDERSPPAAQPETAPGDAAPEAPAPIRLRPSAAQRVAPRRSPSSREGGGTLEARDLLARRDGRGAARGSVIHAWLAAIGWLDEGVPDGERLLAIARDLSRRDALQATETELAAWRSDLDAMLGWPAVRSVLERPTGDDVDLWRERRFAVLLPDERGERGERGIESLVAGAFDRVLVTRRDGRPLSAQIVDFKTDRPDPARGGLDARVEHYRPQMAAYRAALCALTGLPAASVTAKLLFLEPGELREV